MPDNRLARTRAAYESTDPMNRIARIYLKHASGLIRDGRAAEAVSAIDEAVRILNPIDAAVEEMSRITDNYISPAVASLRPAIDENDRLAVCEFVSIFPPRGC